MNGDGHQQVLRSGVEAAPHQPEEGEGQQPVQAAVVQGEEERAGRQREREWHEVEQRGQHEASVQHLLEHGRRHAPGEAPPKPGLPAPSRLD